MRSTGKCRKGHSLEDAYIEKDAFGKDRKRCKPCHLARVKASKNKPTNAIIDSDGKIVYRF